MSRWRFPIAVFGTILAAIIFGRLFSVPSGPVQIKQRASQEVQDERRAAIDKLIKLGFISEVKKPSSRYPDMAYIYILPPFHDLLYDKKLTTVIYCFAWSYEIPLDENGKITLDEAGNSMILKDARTNKTIGSFDDKFGLSLK